MHLMTLKGNKSIAWDVAPAFDRDCDLLVAGVGTAGTELAILAAEKGLRVIGVEKSVGPCGLSALGGVWDYYYGTKGGAWEARDRAELELAQKGYAHVAVARMSAAEEALTASGADVHYETSVIGVWMEGRCAAGLRVVAYGQTHDIRAKIVADCTGNGLVCRMAGCAFSYGRPWDHVQMAYSKAEVRVEAEQTIKSRYTFNGFMTEPDEETFSRGVLAASTVGPCIWEEGKKNHRIVMTPPLMGFREEGNIIAEEQATFEGALRGERTKTPVFYSFTTQDLSNVSRDYAYEDDALQNWQAMCTLARYGFSVAIPYGAMIPKGYDALLAVGKHLGVDHDLAGGIRMKRDLKKLAEAAAYASFIAVRDGVSVRNVDYDELADMLRSTGCLDESVYEGICDLHTDPDHPGERVKAVLPDTPEAFRAALGKPMTVYKWSMPGTVEKREEASPALALLSAWMMKDRPNPAVADALYERICEKDGFAANYAVALGLMGDERACEQLRDMILHPAHEGELYPSPMKAVCLLGRLGDREALLLLLELVEDYAETCVSGMDTSSRYPVRSDLVHGMLSMALFALDKICKKHPDLREETGCRLRVWAEKPFECPAGWFLPDRAPSLKEIVYRLFPQ